MRTVASFIACLVGYVAGAEAFEGPTTSCRWTANGTTFDLSGLTLPSWTSYNVTDVRADENTDFGYHFNVCADAAVPQNAGCDQSQKVVAYQTDNNNDMCYRLSKPAADGWDFGMFDVNNPARGVVLKTDGGQTCNVNGAEVPRELRLVFQCSHDTSNKFDQEQVTETNTCHYYIQLNTIHGCPTQCLDSKATTICSGNGICGYDTDAGRSRCFCNSGYAGSTCSSRTTKSHRKTTEGVILAFVLLLLVAVVGMVAYMFLKLRRLNVDPSAYENLQGRFNQLSMMTG